ncbi:MAG TPA: hypothetical protein VI485_24845 [Vicinamibacterales bacterium]|nr:hypothetical protein [Vicinamibacterales bacterium]
MAVRRTSAGVLAAAALAMLLGVPPVTAQRPDDLALPPRDIFPAERCGTGDARLRQLGLRPRTAIAPGQAVSFRQDPPVLTSDFAGTVVLHDFTVVGDVPSVRFRLADESSEVETWARVSTRQVGGHLVSVFEPSWSGTAIDRVLMGTRWGWDQLGVYWGELLMEGVEPGLGRSVYLRMALANMPRVQVRRLAADVQYSSHVVNIVMPGFGDGYIDDDYGFDLAGVTSRFYQYFGDSYDSIAVVPESIFIANYSAFHQNVQNAVTGIGLSVFDNSVSYGSQSHRLRSVELFNGYSLSRHVTSAHEISHQWGAYIDWTRLTGLTRAGHQPSSHDPLWADGETITGAVLAPTRRVRRGAAGWVIEQTPAPIRFHPYALYAMGLIAKESVPQITLFDEQGQFDPRTSSTPNAGVAVTGLTRTATIFNVIGMIGERSGPVDSEWHRATVIVSRDRLLTQAEMDYWTFSARRLEDPNGLGVVGFDGAGSFEVANGRGIDLHTDIRPLTAPAFVESFDVDYPRFGQRDWRDVVFDSEVPSHYRVGDRIQLSGVVNARDRSDINTIIIRLWKSGGTTADAIQVQAPVSSRSSFVADIPIEGSRAGVYEMEVFLFWPGSGTQFSRAALSPIVID